MATPPHAAKNAPSGARKPHIFTELARSSERRSRVVERIRYPQEMPARTPHKWMTIWAGVQKVSRPIERCHEMSQWIPTMEHVTAAAAHHTYHGTRSDASGVMEGELVANRFVPCTCNYRLSAQGPRVTAITQKNG